MNKFRSDRDVVLAAVCLYGELQAHFASEEVQADSDFVIAAVNQHSLALDVVAEIRETVFEKNLSCREEMPVDLMLKFDSKELQLDKEVLLAAIAAMEPAVERKRQAACTLEDASSAVRAERELVRVAVLQDGSEFVQAVMMKDGIAMMSATKKLRAAEMAEEAASDAFYKMQFEHLNNYYVLEFASEELQADRDVVLAAVRIDGGNLMLASDELRADREVVLTAVNNDGYSLLEASEALQADKGIVLAAVKQAGMALCYTNSEELRSDKEVVLAAVTRNGSALKFASATLQADKEVVLIAVDGCADALLYVAKELRAGKQVKAVARESDNRNCSIR